MTDNILEQKKLAVTKLELKIREALLTKRKEILANPRARREIEELRKNYMLDDHTIAMFISVGMATEYTNLLNQFNKILDGDLS
jgi:hypothetical protein